MEAGRRSIRPAADILYTRRLRAVCLDGVFFSPARLDELRGQVPPTATGEIGLVRRE